MTLKHIFTLATFAMGLSASAQGIYQFEDAGFENWTGNNTPGHEWHSFESAIGKMANLGKGSAPKPKKETENPYEGTTSLKIYSKSILGKLANGNITTGVINMGSMTPADASNYNFTKRDAEGKHLVFAGTPDAVSFYAKFKSGGSPNGRGRFILHGDVDYRDPELNGDQTGLVGEAVVLVPPTDAWTHYEGTFSYKASKPTTQYLLASFTTNPTPGGSQKDYLYVDNVKFIYYNTLKSLSYDGATINFDEATTSYDLSTVAYDEEKLHYDKKGQGANTSLSYDKESAIATITVEGNDISVNPTNKTVYTLQFAPEKKAEETTYSNDLSVTIVSADGNSCTAPETNSINFIKEVDDSYSLELKNFVLGGMIPVGNIKVANLTKNDNTYTTSQIINITAGDDEKYGAADWLGPMLGEVPVVVNATINGDQMVAQISIKDFPGVGDINVTFAPTINLTEENNIDVNQGVYNVVLTRSFKQGWNTVCLPFATTANNLGAAKAQAFTAANDYSLTFDEVANGQLEANVPYMLYFDQDKEYTADDAYYYGGVVEQSLPIASIYNGFQFMGNYQANMSLNNCYSMVAEGQGYKLVACDETATLPAGHAYFKASMGVSLDGLRVCFDGGQVTGVNTIVNGAATLQQQGAVYNLQGVKVSCNGTAGLPAGIYIQHGKKVIVK